jgi:hypothetical protein
VLSGEPTLSPVVGQFVNPSPLEAAFLHQDGLVHILALASGETVLGARLSQAPGITGPAFILAPTLLPGRGPADLDSVLAVREDRHLVNIRADGGGSIEDGWEGRPIGAPGEMSVQSPAVVRFAGAKLGEAAYGLVFVSNMRKIVFADTRFADRAATVTVTANYEAAQTSIVAGCEDGEGLVRQILWSDPQRHLVVLRIDSSAEAARLALSLRQPMDCLQQVATSPALLDLNRDGAVDVVLNSGSLVTVLDGRFLQGAPGSRIGALLGFRPYAAIEKLATPCAPFMTSDGEPFAAIGDRHVAVYRHRGDSLAHARRQLYAQRRTPLDF